MTTAEKRIKEAYERKDHTCFTDLVKKVQEWAEEKDLLHEENAEKQFMKFMEEVFEFKSEMDFYIIYDDLRNVYDKSLKLEMGDILVTLIILSKQLDIDMVGCLEMAYEKISKRKGKTVDGIFYKQEDLEGMEWEK